MAAPHEPLDPLDRELDEALAASDSDLSKVYYRYQEEFFQKHHQSLQLAMTERNQRQLLHYFTRRNNALLDALDLAECPAADSQPGPVATERLRNVAAMNPNLAPTLKPLLENIGVDGLPTLDGVKFSNSLKINMLLGESVSELEVDDLLAVEKNPQDIEFWLRRNQPNLVLSRFKPIEFKNNKIIKQDSNLDNLNNNFNVHTNHTANKRRKK